MKTKTKNIKSNAESQSSDDKNAPICKARSGRFQISIWKRKKIIPARNDYDCEREIEVVRACIQYGRKNRITGNWENQSIWANPDELASLRQALDELDKAEEEGE